MATENKVRPNKCILCSEVVYVSVSQDSKLLTNGNFYHQRCCESLLSLRAEKMQQLSKASQKKEPFFGDAFSRVASFIGMRASSTKQQQSKAFGNADDLSVPLARIEELLLSVHDFLPIYPPDWEDRRRNLLSQRYSCERCGESNRLQIHHRLPVSRGGSHQALNLEVLCERCHAGTHGSTQSKWKKHSYGQYDKDTAFARKIEQINQAIQTRKAARFHYEKFDGEKSDRTVSPIGIVLLDDPYRDYSKHKDAPYFRGYCFLRKEERTFRFDRMSRVRLVALPSL
ncbi:MAG: WYL domain-containing protein [Chitinophagaceae bacterium]|nr:WYL domain-containing protein [Chitinophagaceae bacterium]